MSAHAEDCATATESGMAPCTCHVEERYHRCCGYRAYQDDPSEHADDCPGMVDLFDDADDESTLRRLACPRDHVPEGYRVEGKRHPLGAWIDGPRLVEDKP